MALTPLDILNKQFSRSFRGYDTTQVDEFLEQVGREYDQVLRDNAALREQVEALTAKLDQYRQLEDTLHNTLVVAQETAEEVKASAQKQAELIINQARMEADQIVQEARARAEQIERRYNELLNSVKVVRARLRAMLMSHLQLLEEAPDVAPDTEGAAGQVTVEAAAAEEPAGGGAGAGGEAAAPGPTGSAPASAAAVAAPRVVAGDHRPAGSPGA
ncbi:MAG TPA: DivIVA domain-containing protein [Thermaerobacter sp.]